MSDWFTITMSTVSLVLSCISTAVSSIVACYTVARRPRIRMTKPTFVAFVVDGDEAAPKVFLRTLLFSTADPGKVVETMFVRMRNHKQETIYSFWSYDVDGRLVPGGGLFIGAQGIATNHHFVLAKSFKRVTFGPAELTVDVCARIVGEKRERLLYQLKTMLSADQAAALNGKDAGVFFERNPVSDEFHGEIRAAPGRP